MNRYRYLKVVRFIHYILTLYRIDIIFKQLIICTPLKGQHEYQYTIMELESIFEVILRKHQEQNGLNETEGREILYTNFMEEYPTVTTIFLCLILVGIAFGICGNILVSVNKILKVKILQLNLRVTKFIHTEVFWFRSPMVFHFQGFL